MYRVHVTEVTQGSPALAHWSWFETGATDSEPMLTFVEEVVFFDNLFKKNQHGFIEINISEVSIVLLTLICQRSQNTLKIRFMSPGRPWGTRNIMPFLDKSG